MIKLTPRELPTQAARWLQRWQDEIHAVTGYAERVKQAERKWSARRSSTKTMAIAAGCLVEMSSGLERCNYCEDSAGHQIEHIDPKSFYPEKTFLWENMLFACGQCNLQKSHRHAIFEAGTAVLRELVRNQATGVVPPPAGESVLINPRLDDPSNFFHLDLLDTFFINVRTGLSSHDQQRAEYTRRVLRLNSREALVHHRRVAYESYLALIQRYLDLRDNSQPDEKRQRTIGAVKKGDHRYVWLEMKRQRADVDELKVIFHQAPEAVGW